MDKKISIQDLVDIERLRELFENFSKATGFTTGFVAYPSQELLIATGWRDICTKFHRACPASAECCHESNVYLTACLKDLKELSIKPCGNGLVDGATPVIIRGMHLASLATGQVLLAQPDIAFFKGLAAKYGYDTDEYLAALAKVPVVSEEQLKNALAFLAGLAVQIAEEGLQKLQIQRTADELRKAKAEVDRKVEKRTHELQNANEQLQVELVERQRAEKALLHQADLLDRVSDAIVSTDDAFRIQTWNKAAEKIYGWKAEEVLGKNADELFCTEFVSPSKREAAERLVAEGFVETETVHQDRHGLKLFVRGNVTQLKNAQGKVTGSIGVLRDVTERKRAEDALGKREAQYSAIVEAFDGIIYICSKDYRVEFINQRGIQRCGRNPVGEFCYKALHDLEAVCPWCVNDRVFDGETARWEVQSPKDNRWYYVVNTPIRHPDGIIYKQSMILDITERKRAEEELLKAQVQLKAHAENLEKTVAERTAKLWEQTAERDKLQQELLKISEREKQLIAQEMHDGLCQHFAGTAMMTSLLHRRLAERQDPEADQAKEICELLNTGVLEARNLSHGLHPVKDKGDGLMEALSGLAQKVANLFHIQCSFCCDEAVLVNSQATATHLFRIAQEAMNNALKHGQASKVTITLKNENEGVCLSIRDNGIGIPRELPATRGMGMQIMNHRAEGIGAWITIRRAGKRGTVVTCTLPTRLT